MHQERLATQREITKRYALDNAIVEGSVLDREALSSAFAQLADALSGVINSSGLPRQTREDFLRNLAGWPQIITSVAARQSKLPNGKGPRQEEDQSES